MERANTDILRLADEFVRESSSIKSKSELIAKLAEYERRITDSQRITNPIAQGFAQQVVY